jgi:hypothetical protein
MHAGRTTIRSDVFCYAILSEVLSFHEFFKQENYHDAKVVRAAFIREEKSNMVGLRRQDSPSVSGPYLSPTSCREATPTWLSW